MGYSSLQDRKKTGSHYTPDALAQFVAREMLQAWQSSPGTLTVRVLDPAIGDGGLLLAILQELTRHGVADLEAFGFDTDPHAVDFARAHIGRHFPTIPLHVALEDFLYVSTQYLQPDLFSSSLIESYDLIIANPPYVRTQVMGSENAQNLAHQFGLSGRVDLYHAFIEGIARVLKPGGIAGIIVSNRFMTTKSGADVRANIMKKFDVLHIWDLGDTHLFEAAVLPAVLIVRQKTGTAATEQRFTSIYSVKSEAFEHRCHGVVEALSKAGNIKLDNGEAYRVMHGTLDHGTDLDGVWRLANDASDQWLDTVLAHTSLTFKDIGEVRVGVKTTADKVFIRSDWSELPTDQRPELLRPLTTHLVARRFRASEPQRTTEILYTHINANGKRMAVRLEDFPRSAKYLNSHRPALEARDYVIESGRKWYELWVPQDPDAWARPKVIFRDIVEKPTFWMDLSGSVVNGDCYWLTSRAPERAELLWLTLAIGNSSFIEMYYDHRFHNKLYSGRRRFMTQYVEKFPLPDPTSTEAQHLISLAKAIYETMPTRDTTELEKELDQLVWQAFGVDQSSKKSLGRGI
jgi:adenine-specific DNA-methyltransferase